MQRQLFHPLLQVRGLLLDSLGGGSERRLLGDGAVRDRLYPAPFRLELLDRRLVRKVLYSSWFFGLKRDKEKSIAMRQQ